MGHFRAVAGLRQAQTGRTVALSEDHSALKESLEVRVEIAQMVRMIGRAKLEIASIKHPMAEEDDRMIIGGRRTGRHRGGHRGLYP